MSSSTCSCVNNNTFHLKPVVESPPSLPRVPNPQKGIVSILGSDCSQSGGGGAAPPSSIRRTLSADMSSKNLLSHNGSIKKREEEDDEDDGLKRPGQDEVWKSIQAQKQLMQQGVVNDHKPIRSSVSWSAVLLSNQKVVDQDSPPPYIHPLLKKSSSSSLSKQSLQICTESLGSETGSDSHHIQNEVQDKEAADKEEDIFNDVKIINYYSKKSPPTPPSFPPPLPSLANSSVHLRSHRQGGGERLILEAVSIPQRNFFHAERSHGRLLLTALKTPDASNEEASGEDETEGFKTEEVDDGSEEEEEHEEAAQAKTASLNTNTNHLYWEKSNNTAEYKQQQQQQEGLIPLLRSCKEARRSLLTWETNYCIATS